MAHIIDLEEVASTVAPNIERYKADSNKPGSDGVLARLGVECDLAITLWRCSESNRGTNPNLILDAMLTACAAHVVGELMQHVESPEARTMSAMNIGGRFIQAILTGCHAIDNNEFEPEFIASKEVGTA